MAPPLIRGVAHAPLVDVVVRRTVGLQVGTLVGSTVPRDLDCVDIGRRQTILRFTVAPSRRSALLRSRSATCGLDGAPANLSLAIVAGPGDDHALGVPHEHRHTRLCEAVDANDSQRYRSRHHDRLLTGNLSAWPHAEHAMVR